MSYSNDLEAGKWIKATLQAGSSLKAYNRVVPSGKTLPAFRFQMQMSDDIRTVSQHIAMSRYKFLVVVTMQGEVLEAGPNGFVTHVEYISDTLHKAYGETSKARILACTRLESYDDQENVGSDVLRHGGAIFEVLVMGLPESE